MAPVDPLGAQKYWYGGLPFGGVRKTTSPPDEGTKKYWYTGKPSGFLYGTSGGGGPTPGAPEAFYTLMIGM